MRFEGNTAFSTISIPINGSDSITTSGLYYVDDAVLWGANVLVRALF
jgi:hypothetical protein